MPPPLLLPIIRATLVLLTPLSPMPVPPDLAPLAPGLLFWHRYDPAVKADLWSHALATSAGLYLIDPIPLSSPQIDALRTRGPLAGIIVTNANHLRACGQYAAEFKVPVFGHADTIKALAAEALVAVGEGETIAGELNVITLDGAPAGEIALHQSPTRTLAIGDALINFDPHGFTFLPRKYCTDFRRMRHSLGKLLCYDVERIVFAHGTPILSGGNARLRQLLEAG